MELIQIGTDWFLIYDNASEAFLQRCNFGKALHIPLNASLCLVEAGCRHAVVFLIINSYPKICIHARNAVSFDYDYSLNGLKIVNS